MADKYNADVDVEKDAETKASDDLKETTFAENGEVPLQRQLKNRHIAMIRYRKLLSSLSL